VADWSFTPEVKANVNDILSAYVGTHNFHNFTEDVEASDPSASRYILRYEVRLDGGSPRCAILLTHSLYI